MKFLRIKTIVFFIIIILFVSPFFFLTKFIQLSADDFCRANSSFSNYFINVINWYSYENGRYTNALISNLPIYNLFTYRIFIGASFLTFGFSIYYFTNKLMEYYFLQVSIIDIFLITTFFYIVVISQLPSLFEFFYWLAGNTAYLYTTIFLLLTLGKLLKLLKYRNNIMLKEYAVIAFLLILLIGNNEMILGAINLILLFSWIYLLIIKNNRAKDFLMFNIISWLSSLAIVFAPGTINRKSYFSGGGNLFYSIKNAFLSAGMFFFKSLMEWDYLLIYMSLFLTVIIYSKKNDLTVKAFNPFVLLVISYIILTSIFFIPYYAIGFLNVNDGRVGNFIHVSFLIILMMNIVNIAIYSFRFTIFNIQYLNKFSTVCLCSFLLITFTKNTNYLSLYFDISNHAFSKFEEEMVLRNKIIQRSNEDQLILERITLPRTINFYDGSKEPKSWINKCETNYYNKKFNKNFKSIIVR